MINPNKIGNKITYLFPHCCNSFNVNNTSIYLSVCLIYLTHHSESYIEWKITSTNATLWVSCYLDSFQQPWFEPFSWDHVSFYTPYSLAILLWVVVLNNDDAIHLEISWSNYLEKNSSRPTFNKAYTEYTPSNNRGFSNDSVEKIRLWSYFHWERKETQKRGKWHTGEYVVLCNTISSSNQTKGRTHACNNHCCICHLLASITSLYCPYGILGSFPDVHNVQLLYYTGHLLLARDHPPCFELNVVLR